ncbi:LysR family transcriptional regulator ArgP [Plantactinospora soyae]|uniref:HTH-type transcriptional regulator LysG n=1 Tax=Plantactinospora soyae TaxID=1544732 RepID=A0A927M7X3_9ACTN|nr:LysR family transcriptional regulator ArgP [Plantactinospora soyae]MBE1488697.1 LysR family transcriptional regulator (chromosome initiation inhibitor) [Plantactinospora soyae]
MDVQFEQLRTFLAVVDHGSFEAAARQLHVTPSAVSQRMKALESSVGQVLVERAKPVRPTRSGQVVLRLARQVALLETDAVQELGYDSAADPAEFTRIPVVVNGDSLNTWVLPALAAAARQRIGVDVYREDQDHSVELLRRGTVLAAITSEDRPVQGCAVRPLGRMRYRPMASPEFVRTWLPDGPTIDDLARSPVLVFDRRDDLQDRYLRQRARRSWDPPRSYLPSSGDFPEAIRLGLGWGMLPYQQTDRYEAAGLLVPIDPEAGIDVPLYWQQWRLDSRSLGVLADAVVAAAGGALER